MDEATKENRNSFLRHLQGLVDQCLNESRKTTERGRMELLVFDILVTLDGEMGDIGPYSVRPHDYEGDEGEDICSAGDTHHEWSRLYCTGA